MKRVKYIVSAAALTILLSACGGSPTESADLNAVLDRTLTALESYQVHLSENNVTEVSDQEMPTLLENLHDSYNAEPKFYGAPIGVALKEDASFDGFKDSNSNNIKDSGESTIFTVEIDSENQRLIATDETGTSTFRGAATGFLAGALIGHLLSRQMGAGIKPGAFNNRKVSSPASYSSARAASRSGGSSSRK
ncbi:MAG: hypothetical protein P8179_05035 [Candidatus Thiodiazotropha sp.]